MTIEDAVELIHAKAVNLNWYVFGAALLTVGMFLITNVLFWFIVSVPVLWLFGLTSAIVIAGNRLKKWSKEHE